MSKKTRPCFLTRHALTLALAASPLLIGCGPDDPGTTAPGPTKPVPPTPAVAPTCVLIISNGASVVPVTGVTLQVACDQEMDVASVKAAITSKPSMILDDGTYNAETQTTSFAIQGYLWGNFPYTIALSTKATSAAGTGLKNVITTSFTTGTDDRPACDQLSDMKSATYFSGFTILTAARMELCTTGGSQALISWTETGSPQSYTGLIYGINRSKNNDQFFGKRRFSFQYYVGAEVKRLDVLEN